jgi:TRAP-type C4-dicarboxylate transport system permease small subunit
MVESSVATQAGISEKVIGSIEFVSDWLDRVALVLGMACLVFITGSMFLGVIARFVFHFSYFWVEESCKIMSVWFSYLAASVALKHGNMVAVKFFSDRMGPKNQWWLTVTVNMATLVLLWIGVRYGTSVVLLLLSLKQKTPTMYVPIGLVYAAIPIGCFVMIFHILSSTINVLRTKFYPSL